MSDFVLASSSRRRKKKNAEESSNDTTQQRFRSNDTRSNNKNGTEDANHKVKRNKKQHPYENWSCGCNVWWKRQRPEIPIRRQSIERSNSRKLWVFGTLCATLLIIFYGWCSPRDWQEISSISSGSRGIEYPMVSQRNSKEMVPGYSRFLQVMLTRTRSQQISPQDSFRNRNHFNSTIAVAMEHRSSVDFSNATTTRFTTTLDVLHSHNCQPGWMCHQCLAFYSSSLQNCQSFCPDCYGKLLCSTIHRNQYLSIRREREQEPQTQQQEDKITVESRIPRIIHQVGLEEWLDASRFPNLVRLQNSWRAQMINSNRNAASSEPHNFVYRYYTPDLTRHFVQEHYTSLHEAYVALSDTEQRRIFGLMVLHQSGGVVADIELLLEINLESILSGDTTFVAASVSHPLGTNCAWLWDGLVAAQPKHPVLARAIQLYFELEQKPTSVDQVARVWELSDKSCSAPNRQREPLCKVSEIPKHRSSYALGKAYRDIVWVDPVLVPDNDDMLFGFQQSRDSRDQSLLLLLSPKDTGATRITDVTRNLLVASTDILGISLNPLSTQQRWTLRSSKTSETKR